MKNDGFKEMNDELLEFLVRAIEDRELSLVYSIEDLVS